MDNRKEVIISFVLIFLVIFSLISHYLFHSDDKLKRKKEMIAEFDRTNAVSEVNKYSLKDIDKETMAILYLNDYLDMIVNYPDEAYSLISNPDVISKSDFLDYSKVLANNSDNDYYNLQNYSYYQENSTHNFVYRVSNKKDQVFTFRVHAVMDYEVDMNI